MNYAIVEACGKQYWFEPGFFYEVDRLSGTQPGDKISFNKILLVKNGEKTDVGDPCIENVKVNATVLKHSLGSKIVVFKMRPKKRSRFKTGFRRKTTRIHIDSIN
jgi:large subunit ribosomal protein L21